MLKDLKEFILFLVDVLLQKPNVENGFIEKHPWPRDFMHDDLGGVVKKKILVPNGQWDKYLPEAELQKRQGSETMACVTFSAMNCLETLLNFYIQSKDKEHQKIVEIFEQFNLIKNGKANFSDRYIAKLSGTTRRGNSQFNVANAIRKYGLVPEEDCPWIKGWSNYYNLNKGTKGEAELIRQGKEFLNAIEFNYEWVHPLNINSAEKFGTIQTSVYAWWKKIKDIYIRTLQKKNHCIQGYAYLRNKYDKLFDTYPPVLKKTAWNFDLGWGMLYSFHVKKNFNLKFLKRLLKDGKKYIIRSEARGQVYRLSDNNIDFLNSNKDDISREVNLFNEWVDYLRKIGVLIGISEKDFKDLIG